MANKHTILNETIEIRDFVYDGQKIVKIITDFGVVALNTHQMEILRSYINDNLLNSADSENE